MYVNTSSPYEQAVGQIVPAEICFQDLETHVRTCKVIQLSGKNCEYLVWYSNYKIIDTYVMSMFAGWVGSVHLHKLWSTHPDGKAIGKDTEGVNTADFPLACGGPMIDGW